MTYGVTTYKKDKGIEVGFASHKNHIFFYCLVHQVMLDNKELLKGLNHGNGVIRCSNPYKIDFEFIKNKNQYGSFCKFPCKQYISSIAPLHILLYAPSHHLRVRIFAKFRCMNFNLCLTSVFAKLGFTVNMQEQA